MNQIKISIYFLVIFNLFSSVLLFTHRLKIIFLDKIFFDLISNLLFIWNILLLYLINKYFRNEKNRK